MNTKTTPYSTPTSQMLWSGEMRKRTSRAWQCKERRDSSATFIFLKHHLSVESILPPTSNPLFEICKVQSSFLFSILTSYSSLSIRFAANHYIMVHFYAWVKEVVIWLLRFCTPRISSFLTVMPGHRAWTSHEGSHRNTFHEMDYELALDVDLDAIGYRYRFLLLQYERLILTTKRLHGNKWSETFNLPRITYGLYNYMHNLTPHHIMITSRYTW